MQCGRNAPAHLLRHLLVGSGVVRGQAKPGEAAGKPAPVKHQLIAGQISLCQLRQPAEVGWQAQRLPEVRPPVARPQAQRAQRREARQPGHAGRGQVPVDAERLQGLRRAAEAESQLVCSGSKPAFHLQVPYMLAVTLQPQQQRGHGHLLLTAAAPGPLSQGDAAQQLRVQAQRAKAPVDQHS